MSAEQWHWGQGCSTGRDRKHPKGAGGGERTNLWWKKEEYFLCFTSQPKTSWRQVVPISGRTPGLTTEFSPNALLGGRSPAPGGGRCCVHLWCSLLQALSKFLRFALMGCFFSPPNEVYPNQVCIWLCNSAPYFKSLQDRMLSLFSAFLIASLASGIFLSYLDSSFLEASHHLLQPLSASRLV